MQEPNEAEIHTPSTSPAKKRTWWQFGTRIFFRTIKYSFNSLLLLLVVGVILLQFSFIQTFAFHHLLNYVSKKLDFKVSVSHIYIDFWNSYVHFEDLSVRDLQNKQMIFAKKLDVNFSYNTVFKNKTILLNEVFLYKASVNLITDKESKKVNINQFIEKIQKLTTPKKPNPNAKPIVFRIQKAVLENSYFGLSNNTRPYTYGDKMDYNHFGIDELYGHLQNFRVAGDSVESQINQLSGIEPRVKLPIKNLTTFFRMTSKSIEFSHLFLHAGNSFIKDELFMSYKKQKDLSDFVNKVNIIAHLDSTVVDTDDLAIFAPAVRRYKDVWRVKGTFKGKVKDFSMKELDLYLGKQSHIHGNIEFVGLPDIKNTFMQLDVEQSRILAVELEKYIPAPDIAKVLNKLGFVNFRANLTGFVSDFVANGNFQTSLGHITSDINLKVKENRNLSYYKGRLKTQNFMLGKLFDAPELGEINMDGNIEGTGFSPRTAKLTMDAKIHSIDFHRYTYRDLEVDGELSSERFKGELIAQDPNFDFIVNGEIDFNKVTKDVPAGRFNLQSSINKISLQPLNFSPHETIISGDLQLDTYGLSLDSLTGEAMLTNAHVLYKDKGLYINTLDFLSFKTNEGGRFFEVRSDFLNFHIDGNFLFSTVVRDLEELYNEYFLGLENHLEEIEEYYQKKKKRILKRYKTNFALNVKNINPILNLFTPHVHLSRDTRFKGEFSHGKASRFVIYTEHNIDSLTFNNNSFSDIRVDINTSKLANSGEILAEGFISSKKQVIGNAKTEDASFYAIWGGDLIDFDFKAKQSNSSNYANVKGDLHFRNDTTQINFRSSEFQFLKERWKIKKENLITLSRNTVSFDNLVLYNEDAPNSKISIDGYVSDTIQAPLLVSVQDVEIRPFADFVGIDMQGKIIEANTTLKDVFKHPDIVSNLNLENLMFEDLLIGDVQGDAKWIKEKEKLELNFNVYRRGRYILELGGHYIPEDKNNSLDLVADLNGTDLQLLEPFIAFLASDLGGTANGQLKITGTMAEPVVHGKLGVKNGRFRLNYLNTVYELEGDVFFEPDQIKTENMLLFDDLSNPATLKATVFHNNFKDIYLQIQGKFYNFQLLNTTAKDNKLFYGTAYGTGALSIQGFTNALVMDIRAKTRKNTKLFIPLDGHDEVYERDYIHFVSKDTKKDSLAVQKIDLGGLKLNFNLDVTPDAEFEIIFDEKVGDVIRGNGEGNIEMKIDTEGDFNMFGYYIIRKGKYNFTFAGLVNKAFNIQSGSRITFNGDLYESILDVHAIYRKSVSLKPLIDMDGVEDPENAEYRRPYPVEAEMALKGKFLSPEISLDVNLEEAKKTTNPNLQTVVFQLDTKMRSDEQERNRQVFSLLILNRLSSINSFATSAGAAAGSSLGELISNQFSNWISQVDENLELTFDVDPSNFSSFQLRVSYSLLDGRLRITRDGGFTNTQNQADFASVVGDWTVEYLLTPGGKYRLKMYNRTNQTVSNIGANLNTLSTSKAGASFMHTASFNNLKDLFRSRKKKEEERKIVERELEEGTSATLPVIFGTTDSTSKHTSPQYMHIREEDLMPLQHRDDSVKLKNTQSIKTHYTGHKNTIPVDPKTQHLSGDEDNEPIPDRYKKNIEERDKQGTEAIEKSNKKKEGLPFPHRFDKWEEKVSARKRDK